MNDNVSSFICQYVMKEKEIFSSTLNILLFFRSCGQPRTLKHLPHNGKPLFSSLVIIYNFSYYPPLTRTVFHHAHAGTAINSTKTASPAYPETLFYHIPLQFSFRAG